MSARWNTIISLVLGVSAGILFVAVLTGLDVPLAQGGMTSFIALAVISVATCVNNALSATRFGAASSTYWTHPLSIIGIILGTIALILIVLTLAGIIGPTTGFVVLGVVVFLKVGFKVWQNAILK